MDWDVIVVGAGPAGSAAALLLARRGFRVALLDKSAAPPDKICGEYMSPGSRRLLDLVGAKERLFQRGIRSIGGMIIHTRRARTLRAIYPPGPDWIGLAVPRRILDPLLLELAVKEGAQFHPGFQVSDLLWKDGQVEGVQVRRQGRMDHLKSRLVVGADGRASVVARRLGKVRKHRSLDKFALGGYFTGVERDDGMGEVFLGRDCYTILNPIAPEITNAALVVNREEFQSGARNPSLFLKALCAMHRDLPARLARARAVTPVRALGPLAHRAGCMGTGGALLIGDAAGFLDPFTGEGIYSALRSAELAAEFIGEALEKEAGHPDLSGYNEIWRREFQPKWKLCMGLQYAIRHPSLAEWIVGRLSSRPGLTSRLMAAVGDLIPPKDLGFLRLLRSSKFKDLPPAPSPSGTP